MAETYKADVEAVYDRFYRVTRCGVNTLSDLGGPFGFDIQAALMVDHLMMSHGCDAIVEAGCHMGDTTEFLCKRYSGLPVVVCDINREYAQFTAARLRNERNLEVFVSDSRDLIRNHASAFARPFIYLDAHSTGKEWPLDEELALIYRGVVCIDDFDVGDRHFAFDHYEGARCGPEVLKRHAQKIGGRYFTMRQDARFPLPCLQPGRRAGKAFIEIGMESSAMEDCGWFKVSELG